MPCRSPNYWPENVPLDRLECSVRQLKLHQLGFGLLLALSSGAAIAVSLGQVQMRSSLGQPLLADIPIYDADEQDLESLTVALASESAFRRLGLERRQYQDIQIQVIEDENGQMFVQLQSVKPFNEPVFNVLLDANWQNGGHLVREFTALVDPPYIAKTAVQTIEAPTVLLAPVVAAPEVAPNRTPSIPTGSQAPCDQDTGRQARSCKSAVKTQSACQSRAGQADRQCRRSKPGTGCSTGPGGTYSRYR